MEHASLLMVRPGSLQEETQMRTRTVMVLTGLVFGGLAAPAAANPPLIASTVMSSDKTTLTIRGVHLGLDAAETEDCATLTSPAPQVTLEATALTVTASCRTQVTATLPTGLVAGTYLLTLQRSDQEIAVFYPTFGAAGPQGAAGPAGPAGRIGAPGRNGPPGATGPQGPAFTATDARSNTALGTSALGSNTTGQSNTAIGPQALAGSTTGSTNVAVGGIALQNNTEGSSNTAIGYASLRQSLGSFNIALGFRAGQSHIAGDNNIYIGSYGSPAESGVIRIGLGTATTQTHLSGTVTAPAFVGDGSRLTNVPAVYQP